ncbi:DUF4174 domain-containing protein [Paracoccus laeviglucosivorans]|uniref:DUF4174 domain-containing protein n=1 Tax=Paracoccus laeviglucosivorans TaxID=1197861 RepID=A0A521C8A5_9RHOB|nr:DUF4174 domain-containing protein [Paracoccus laeviglucosivorans]SMO55624.1 protein of unknown function [Paracoccus laeviglucosivorans]
MKLKRLIFLAMVPLVAAMGARPEGDGHQPYVRGEVPAARSDNSPSDAGNARELRILPASEADPQEFLWQARPVVVFADSAADPAFSDQIRMLERDSVALNLRDVVVVTDSDPAANTVWRRQLRPEGFSLVLLDKDGQVKQRKPAPWSVREISRAIDKFPLRLQEIGRARLP